MLDGTDAVFLVIAAGVGKSLTLNFLAGRGIAEVVNENGEEFLDVADILQRVSSVDHYVINRTREPRAFRDASSNLAFVDTLPMDDVDECWSLVDAATIALAVRRGLPSG
jgi:hypothetical protein